jgi:mRNA deadenylase 3'-5' endonuclease subunit Ccr4
LADSLVEHTAELITDIDKNTFLNWESRRTRILNELSALNSDIICLQEFEKDETFILEMGKNGYDVCFKPRTGGTHSEGNAIFWKFDKYLQSKLGSTWRTCIALNSM